MTMNQDTENFEKLRRLLKLKRYEQPPPRYFNDFSGQVIARIRLGDRGEDSAVIGRLLWEAPWLQRIWAAFEAKPVLAGAFGVAMCAWLITGVIYSEKADVQPVALIPVSDAVPNAPEFPSAISESHPLLAKPAALYASSTNPITALQIDGPLLNGLRLHAQPASFPFSRQK
jgi:hypothetical protein